MNINDKKGINHYTLLVKALNLSVLHGLEPCIYSHSKHYVTIKLTHKPSGVGGIILCDGLGRKGRYVGIQYNKENKQDTLEVTQLLTTLGITPYDEYDSQGDETYYNLYIGEHELNQLLDHLLTLV